MVSQRSSYEEEAKREIPSFIEARPPLVLNPFMRPRPTKGKRLFTSELMEDLEFEDSAEEPELVQVYLRLKPCSVRSNLYEVHSDRSLITSLDTTTAGHGRRTQHNVSKMYTFSHIFGPNSNQKEIFERVAKDNLKKLPDGNSFTLLMYGASGSGKTFTLMGTVTEPGIVPRSLEYVFKVVEAAQHPLYKPDEKGAYRLSNAEQEFELKVVRQLRKISGNLPEYRDRYRRMSASLGGDLTSSNIDLANRRSHYVWVSFIEIYNEAIYDLLTGDRRNAPKLAIREDASGNVYVKGAMQTFVRSSAEAYDVLVAGKLNLQVAATGIHAHSSRSHCIFTITMLTETENGMRSACVRLCDLAGCERAARTRNTGARMQESRAINASLHVLERCLHTLRRKRTTAALVPYRESKLTRLLGGGLSGMRGEAVSMVVTLNPSPEYANETKHVLQLAAVAKDIQISSDTLTEYPSSLESSSQDTTIGYTSFEVMKLRADNERLLFELKQAQARIKERDERLAAHDMMMWEALEETKANYKKHYEAQLKALQNKMEEMEEEYECRLRELTIDIPCKKCRKRKKLSPMEKETAEMECRKQSGSEKAEEELSEVIEDNNEIISDNNNDMNGNNDDMNDNDNDEDVISLIESDVSDNESLIPPLTKEQMNHVKKVNEDLKILNASRVNDSTSEEIDAEESKDTQTDHDDDPFLTSENLNSPDKINDSDRSNIDNADISTVKKAVSRFTYVVDGVNDDVATTANQEKKIVEPKRQLSRETYCVTTSEVLNISKEKLQDDIAMPMKNDIVKDVDITKSNEIPKSLKNMIEQPEDTVETKNEIGVSPKINQSTEINNSLLQFQRFEKELTKIDDSKKAVSMVDDVPEPLKDTVKVLKHKVETKSGIRVTPKITGLIKQSTGESDNSLLQFERLEIETSEIDKNNKRVTGQFYNIKHDKENRKFFDDDIDDHPKTPETVVKAKNKQICFDKSHEEENNLNRNFKNTVVPNEEKYYFLGESMTRQADKAGAVKDLIESSKAHDSMDIFEEYDSPRFNKNEIVETQARAIEIVRNTIEKTATSNKIDLNFDSLSVIESKSNDIDDIDKIVTFKKEDTATNVKESRKKEENSFLDNYADNKKQTSKKDDVATNERDCINNNPLNTLNNDESQLTMNSTKTNNTSIEFENIYKDISAPRSTEFDLLVSQESIEENKNKIDNTESVDLKYNLRHKEIFEKPKTERKRGKNKVWQEEILAESTSKCASTSKPTRRNLRLRRQKNTEEEVEKGKLEDIGNLQVEFSDVTMGLPAPVIASKDIPSPEKVENEENSPPKVGIQSCPAKSVTRSRRKLFTPRAEPLDESLGAAAGSDDRVCVPRPSYHRPRARRKL